MTNKTNNSQSIILFLTYLIIVVAALSTFKEHGVHKDAKLLNNFLIKLKSELEKTNNK